MSDNTFAMSMIAVWVTVILVVAVSMALVIVPLLSGMKYSLIYIGLVVGPISIFALFGLKELGNRFDRLRTPQ